MKDAHDREDLLRDATGYLQRVEFSLSTRPKPIVCGYRECGALSVYWTQGDVLQFNAGGELRRAYWRDRMLASYRRTLHWLDKSDGRIRLSRIPLCGEESAEFMTVALSWLRLIRIGMTNKSIHVLREHPENSDVLRRLENDGILNSDREIPLSVHPGLQQRKT